MENRLTILGESPKIGDKNRVVAECICGTIKTYRTSDLRSGNTTSCGCKNRYNNPRYGMTKASIYRTWAAMKDRCANPNNEYWNRYGGRGITVCDRWKKFKNFYEDMGDRPEGKQLDRIDNDKGYYAENCRWVTPKQNSNNQERCVKIELGYIHLTIAELAELAAVSWPTIKKRWHRYGNAWDCLFPPAN